MIGFAAVGFLLPLLSMVFYVIARHFDKFPDMTLLMYVCPSTIISMALDNASAGTAVVVWLMISASNAVLYALIPFAIVLIYRVIRPDPQPDGRWLR